MEETVTRSCLSRDDADWTEVTSSPTDLQTGFAGRTDGRVRNRRKAGETTEERRKSFTLAQPKRQSPSVVLDGTKIIMRLGEP